jgi:hypothetical protein
MSHIMTLEFGATFLAGVFTGFAVSLASYHFAMKTKPKRKTRRRR